ncbi:MAG: DUF2127 domain-containing protein [Rhodanobacter sp.]|nr:MAG: DUF2127 domain-containing protein [Rhodanobacter sp.]TAM08826.1 MAG: DUF2127 domain-containing protein [Rhodanobacter sp.]TAM36868.1 MAG: DUF2127 domain-containing protein [Rhodanobacter sp.]
MIEPEATLAALPADRTDPTQPNRTGLRIIAIYEVAKTACLLLVAVAAFRLDQPQRFEQFLRWLEHLSLAGGSSGTLVHALQAFGPSHFEALGAVALGYAVLFGIEGVGLLAGKYWAEWFTVIATASLIPIELYETVYRFGWLKLAVLIGNIAILGYLLRIALQTRARRMRHQPTS